MYVVSRESHCFLRRNLGSLRAVSLVWVGYRGQRRQRQPRTGEAGEMNEHFSSPHSSRQLLVAAPHLNKWACSQAKIKGHIATRGKQNSMFPKGPVLVICYIANKTKANLEKHAEIPVTTSDHFQLHVLIMCNGGQHFAGNSELFPVWRHSFRNVARPWHLAVNSFAVSVN